MAASLDYFAFELKGLTGSPVSTKIRQTNGALILNRAATNYTISTYDTLDDYLEAIKPAGLTNRQIYEFLDGTVLKEETYTLDLSTFDLSLLIAKGKGPVKLEISPDNAAPYTVTINYDAVTFSGKIAGTDRTADAVDLVVPQSGIIGSSSEEYNKYIHGGGDPAEIGVSKITEQLPGQIYSAEVTSTGGPIGGGPDAIPGGDTEDPYTEMFPDLWRGPNVSKTNVMTLNFALTTAGQIFSDYSTSGSNDITIRQINPALGLYEEDVSGGTWQDAPPNSDHAGWYDVTNPALKWSAPAEAGGHVLYRERAYNGGFSTLDKFHILIMDLPDPADEVVVFTFTYPISGGTVTKSLRIDYSGVKFF
jgi:hypothetical protein